MRGQLKVELRVDQADKADATMEFRQTARHFGSDKATERVAGEKYIAVTLCKDLINGCPDEYAEICSGIDHLPPLWILHHLKADLMVKRGAELRLQRRVTIGGRQKEYQRSQGGCYRRRAKLPPDLGNEHGWGRVQFQPVDGESRAKRLLNQAPELKCRERISTRFVPRHVRLKRSPADDGRPGMGHRVVDTRIARCRGWDDGGGEYFVARGIQRRKLALIEAHEGLDIRFEASEPGERIEYAKLCGAHSPRQVLGKRGLKVGFECRALCTARHHVGNQGTHVLALAAGDHRDVRNIDATA